MADELGQRDNDNGKYITVHESQVCAFGPLTMTVRQCASPGIIDRNSGDDGVGRQ